MTFLNFLYQKVDSAGLSEIVLESFPNNDDSVFFTNETCKKMRHQETQLHLKDCR